MKKTLILTAAAIPTGVAVGAVDALFGRVLLYLGAVRDAHTAWFLPFLGVVGALMAWSYRRFGAGCETAWAWCLRPDTRTGRRYRSAWCPSSCAPPG